MKVVGIFPKQILIGLEFSLEDLKSLKLALDHTTLNLNLENITHKEAEHFVLRELYPLVSKILEDLEEANA